MRVWVLYRLLERVVDSPVELQPFQPVFGMVVDSPVELQPFHPVFGLVVESLVEVEVSLRVFVLVVERREGEVVFVAASSLLT